MNARLGVILAGLAWVLAFVTFMIAQPGAQASPMREAIAFLLSPLLSLIALAIGIKEMRRDGSDRLTGLLAAVLGSAYLMLLAAGAFVFGVMLRWMR